MNLTKEQVNRLVFSDMPAAFREAGHPKFHLTAPSHVTIDFWGPAVKDRVLHIYFHVCPEGSSFQENTHFFHARTQNLLDWELLPCPIAPGEDELRLNDGCIDFDDRGRAIMLYTSVPKGHIPRSHHAAYGNEDLTEFTRPDPDEPFMTLENHGGPAFGWGWSDPFVFRAFGRTFMLMSKCVTPDGQNLLPIYEAVDGSLLHWEYKGILFENNGEVVNFFPLSGKWVLIYSPYNTIEYFVGDLDPVTLHFTPEHHEILSYGYHRQDYPFDRGFYASFVTHWEGRTLLGGWISGFPENPLWDGCMSSLREVILDESQRLCQTPIRELISLREPFTAQTGSFDLEALCLLDEGPVTLTLGDRLTLTIDTQGFTVNGERFDSPLPPHCRLQMLVDRSVAEIFLDGGRVTATRCFADAQGYQPEITSGRVTDFALWGMRSCQIRENLVG
ncbi:MAG: glycoside hydrolase family 32 protein [Clostridia bacterium]|nr:glycoside hydrolase family 32 protein [Clostridia bacterium]